MITTCMSYLKEEVLVRIVELKSYHQLEESRKGQRREETPAHISYQPPRVLLTGVPVG